MWVGLGQSSVKCLHSLSGPEMEESHHRAELVSLVPREHIHQTVGQQELRACTIACVAAHCNITDSRFCSTVLPM